MADNKVQIKNALIKNKIFYKKKLVLSYKIAYPQFLSTKFQAAIKRINRYYKLKALSFQQYCKQDLLKMAIKQFEYSVANNFPIREFEAVLDYKITYNDNCTVSLFFDRYEYTGGAHGNTVRYSDTWNLQNGYRISLSQMFPKSFHYKTYIIKNIYSQIAEQIKNGESSYFDNYRQNVVNSFNVNNFYLTHKGIVVYFQQYDIAPYSSGIPEFTIPYSKGTVIRPQCK